MPLDPVGERYAQNLFTARLGQLTREHATRMAQAREEFAARGLNGHNAGFFHTHMLGLNLERVEAIGNAKADSLVEAYRKARLPIDEAAVGVISEQAGQWIDAQIQHVSQNAKEQIEREGMPANIVQQIDATINHRLAGISSGLRLKLNRLRDEQLLDDRAAANARAAAESRAAAAPITARLETALRPAEESSWAAWWREWKTPTVIVGIICAILAALAIPVMLFPNEIRRHLGFDRPALQAAPVTPQASTPGSTSRPRHSRHPHRLNPRTLPRVIHRKGNRRRSLKTELKVRRARPLRLTPPTASW